MGNRPWTKEEYTYLEESWGKTSLNGIASHLNRSPNAVKIKVVRMGLGAFLAAGEYITVHQLFLAIGKTGGDAYYMKSWVKDRGLPVKYKLVNHSRFKIIYLKDFWAWASDHRSFINWSKFEKNMLGEEPDWVDEQRRNKQLANHRYIISLWTTLEDDRLRSLLKQYKYGYHELSKILRRSVGAIQRRICDLKLKERPLKADNMVKWTEAEFLQLGEMLKIGYDYELMSDALGKSSKAIRGRIYYMYRTENLDAARKLIGSGKWGDGRPDRGVTDRTLNVTEKESVKANIAAFIRMIEELKTRKQPFEAKDYWQKDLCARWNGHRCTAGETNCDCCGAAFIRKIAEEREAC